MISNGVMVCVNAHVHAPAPVQMCRPSDWHLQDFQSWQIGRLEGSAIYVLMFVFLSCSAFSLLDKLVWPLLTLVWPLGFVLHKAENVGVQVAASPSFFLFLFTDWFPHLTSPNGLNIARASNRLNLATAAKPNRGPVRLVKKERMRRAEGGGRKQIWGRHIGLSPVSWNSALFQLFFMIYI